MLFLSGMSVGKCHIKMMQLYCLHKYMAESGPADERLNLNKYKDYGSPV